MDSLSLPVLFVLLVSIVLIQMFLFFWLTKTKRAQKLSEKLMKASQTNDLVRFNKLIDSLAAKMLFGKLEICHQQLQFYMMNDKKEEMDSLAERVLKLNVEENQKQTIITQMWNYYLDNEDKEKVEQLAEALKKIYGEKNNIKGQEKIDFLMDVYIYADIKREKELLKLIKESEGEKQTMYQQHLASLYLKLGEEKKALKLLESAKENSGSKMLIENLILQLKQKNKKKSKKTKS